MVLFIVDAARESLRSAAAVEELLSPDLFVPVANRFVGTSLPEGIDSLSLTMERLEPQLQALVSERRFSFRAFLLGEVSAVPLRLRPSLKSFLQELTSGFREFEPSLSLLKLRG